MSEQRDPRTDPRPGDVMKARGVTYAVTRFTTLRGVPTVEILNLAGEVKRITLAEWRAFTEDATETSH